ncbi:type VII secretion integral membrane protein EccD [Dactylosporangium sp. NPDC005555]|uniref:type VII secretion integral membrane protein EccD n=1 Tax=Dactylosporangium sp. NPDC005555 TaxID=3154889 RepID=UPI0033ABAC38
MTVAATGEMCRLTICGPARQVEVAVPAHVVVSDLLPVLVEHLGENLVESGLLHGGWVLQRLGAPPFDQGATVATLGLRDGDVVHLRPHSEQIPPVDFDDLIDGIASGVTERSGRWRPALTRWTALTAAVVVLAAGVAVLALPGEAAVRGLAAGVLALVWFAGAIVATHALHDRAFGVVFTGAAVGYAGLAGLLAADPRTGVVGLRLDAPALFTGSVAILATASIAALTVAARPMLPAVIVAGLLSTGGSALGAFAGLSMVEAAAALLVAVTLASMIVPMLAFRFAGLRLAPLPTQPEHLQEELDPIPSTSLLPRAAAADRLMSALYAGLAAPAAVAVVIVGAAPGWAPATLAGLIAAVRCLAARPMTSGWHRLAQLLPAAAGAIAVAVSYAAAGTPLTRLAVAALGVPLGAALFLLIARVVPGRRMTPYWGRAGDLLQTLAATAILPVFLAVLDVYGSARGIGG